MSFLKKPDKKWAEDHVVHVAHRAHHNNYSIGPGNYSLCVFDKDSGDNHKIFRTQ